MMLKQQAPTTIESGYTPRWSWRAVWAAGSVTILLYVGLPYLERLSTPARPAVDFRPISTVAPPVPLQPPPEPRPQEATEIRQAPALQHVPRPLSLPPANLHLQIGMGAIAGDFAWGFAMGDFGGPGTSFVFELGDLDEVPRAIVQLRPQYPPQARLRQQEGFVTVEFIVAADGAVEDPVVVAAQPPEIFEQAALRAVARWRFSPGTRAGEAVAVRVRQRVEFRLQ